MSNNEIQHNSGPDVMAGLPTEKLTPSEEVACVQFRDLEKLILHNMREAILYAGRCCRGGIEPGELMSVCYEALSKSAPRFRAGGISFLAYSKADLRGQIHRHWKQQNTVKNAYLHEEEEAPEIKRINRTAGYQEKEWEGPGVDLAEEDSLEPNYAEPEFDAIALRERWAVVQPLLSSCLNERERTVLQLIYEAGFTCQAVGKMMVPKVGTATVSFTHLRALRKLRNALLRKKQLYGAV